ncbi:MAG: hypothetical protein HY751_12975 [Nitrospinae bacterium]|nr:hypothetical protein [Nitrospinota bacterium]
MSDFLDSSGLNIPLPPEITIHHCKSIAATAIKTFAANLNKAMDDALAEADPKLSPFLRKYTQIAMRDALIKTMDSVEREAAKKNRECANAVGEEIKKIVEMVEIERLRSDHFGRIMIRQIEDYFPLRHDIYLNIRVRQEHVKGVVPRQIIGGFLQVIKNVYGADFLTDREDESHSIVKKYQTKIRVTNWNGVFNDDGAKRIIREIFSDTLKMRLVGRNRGWFMSMIKDGKSYREMRRDFDDEDYTILMRVMFLNQEDMRASGRRIAALSDKFYAGDPEGSAEAFETLNNIINSIAKEKRDLFVLQLIHQRMLEPHIVGFALKFRYQGQKSLWEGLKDEMEWVAHELLERARWFKNLPDTKDPDAQTAYFKNKDEANRQYVQTRQALTALEYPEIRDV